MAQNFRVLMAGEAARIVARALWRVRV